MGHLKNNDRFTLGLSWIRKPLETFGIIFTETTEQKCILNFQPKLLILKSTLNIWKERNLSIKGKITVLNTVALSPLTYVSSVILTLIRVFKEIDEITQDFKWNSKT